MADTGNDGVVAKAVLETPPKAHLPADDELKSQQHSHRAMSSSSSSITEKEETLPASPTQTDHRTAPEDNQDLELTRTQSAPMPSRLKALPIMIAVYLSIFLVSLDMTIVGVALPVLSNQFHSFGDIGWYGSAYFMTRCAFQLFWGRMYTFYNVKWLFMLCITLFEVGSLIDATAPNSVAFIWGRAIQGLGGAGSQNGAIAIMMAVTPLKDRPLWMGLVGAVFGISSVLGPIVGGVFTTDATWRWCFYINLPLGGIALVIIFFLLESDKLKRPKTPLREQLNKLDPLGTILFLGFIVSVLLALQWGGTKYAWSNGRIIACFVVAGVCLVAWVVDQVYKGENATVSLRLMKMRVVYAGFWMTFSIGTATMTMSYWLPIWFQAIKQASAAHAGVMNLPLVLGVVFGSILGGVGTKKIGYYNPPAIACTVIASIGAGLFTLFTPTTNHKLWIGAEVMFGFGIGLGMQMPMLAAQTILSKKDVQTGTAIMFLGQTLGGALFVSVGQNVLNNGLVSALSEIPGVNPALIQNSGATDFQKEIPSAYRMQGLQGYNDALVHVFYIAVAGGCATIFGSLLLPWKSTQGQKGAAGKGASKPTAEEKPQDASEKA